MCIWQPKYTSVSTQYYSFCRSNFVSKSSYCCETLKVEKQGCCTCLQFCLAWWYLACRILMLEVFDYFQLYLPGLNGYYCLFVCEIKGPMLGVILSLVQCQNASTPRKEESTGDPWQPLWLGRLVLSGPSWDFMPHHLLAVWDAESKETVVCFKCALVGVLFWK